MKVLDLTHTIKENMPVYPGTEKPTTVAASSYETDGYKETKLSMFSHTGTHIDSPAHVYADKTPLDAFSADRFILSANQQKKGYVLYASRNQLHHAFRFL